MHDHKNRNNHEGDHTDKSGGSGTDEGVAAVVCEVDTDGCKTVNCTVSQNCGNTAVCLQCYIGQENANYYAEQAHHGNACEGETGITQTVVVTDDG